MRRKIHFPNWDSLHSGDSIVLTGLKWYIHLSTPLLAAKLATYALKSWSWWRQMQMDIPKFQVFLRVHRLHMLFFVTRCKWTSPSVFWRVDPRSPQGAKNQPGVLRLRGTGHLEPRSSVYSTCHFGGYPTTLMEMHLSKIWIAEYVQGTIL